MYESVYEREKERERERSAWFMDIYSGSKRRILASGILTAPPEAGGGALMSPYQGPYKGPYIVTYIVTLQIYGVQATTFKISAYRLYSPTN